MTQPRFRLSPERVVRRRLRVPPPIASGLEVLANAPILVEIPGAAGLVIWQSLRDVVLWATTSPAEQAELFAPTEEPRRWADLMLSGVAPELEAPLGTLVAMVGRAGRTEAEPVMLACQRIACWAEAQGNLATALAFAQAAALLCPGNAAAAVAAGRIARKRAEYALSEAWLRRGVLLARQAADWTSYASAFGGLGALYAQRGNFPYARKYYGRALRAAQQHQLRGIKGAALHELFVIASESGLEQSEEAHEYARKAFKAYGSKHTRIPHLAHDIAHLWLTQGDFARSLAVFRAVLPHFEVAAEQIAIHGSIARAAGGTGDWETFEQMWGHIWGNAVGKPALKGKRSHCSILHEARRAWGSGTERSRQRTGLWKWPRPVGKHGSGSRRNPSWNP